MGIRVLLLFSILLVGTLTSSQFAFADGAGSPAECMTGLSNNGPGSIDAGAGNKITGICIKTGNGGTPPSFPEGDHSNLIIVDGTMYGQDNPAGCYEVSGLGTQVVTITDKMLTGCMATSHVDYKVDFNGKVGGHGGITSKTSLLVTGATLNASWMIPLLVSAVGIGVFVITYKNE